MKPFELPELTGTAVPTQSASLDLLGDMELDVRIDLGRAYVQRDDLLRVGQGAIVPLDKTTEEPIDIFAGGRLVARGEPLVLDGNLCVRVKEMISGVAAV